MRKPKRYSVKAEAFAESAAKALSDATGCNVSINDAVEFILLDWAMRDNINAYVRSLVVERSEDSK